MLDTEIENAAARRRLDRRGVPGSHDVDEFWGTGRIGRIARAFFDDPAFHDPAAGDPTGTTSNCHGSVETLERRSDRNRDERAVVLHNRRLPGTREVVGHVVVAPSGVWVVELTGLPGKVAERNVGRWFNQKSRLYVADVDQSVVLESVQLKSEAIERIIENFDVRAASTVDRAACFVEADWPRVFARPLRINDVWVTWPSSLAEMIVADGPLDFEAVHTIGELLARSLRAA